MKYDPEFLGCFDTETTGVDVNQDEILEVCAYKVRRSDRTVVDRFYQKCCPASNFIPEGATKVHGISIEDVAGMPVYLTDGIHEKLAEFLKGTLVCGHNAIKFDLPIAKLDPANVYDTMIEFKKKFPRNRMNIENCCKTLKLEFDADKAHGAEYDVQRTVDLYFALTGEGQVQVDAFSKMLEEATVAEPVVQQQTAVQQAVQAQDEAVAEAAPYQRIAFSIDQIRAKVMSMPLSFSKVSEFMKCPFSWYKTYVEGYKFPDKSYFVVGHICHTVAERAAVWCYRKAFAKRFEIVMRENRLTDFVINPEWEAKVKAEYEYYSMEKLACYLYDHVMELANQPKYRKLSQLIIGVADLVSYDEIASTAVYTPDEVTYEQIFNQAIIDHKVGEPQIINDAKFICMQFKRSYSFDTGSRAVILSERKIAFDREWKVLSDFFSKQAWWRSVIDYIEYHEDHVIIRDYKTSRKMMSQKELESDWQLKCYVASVARLIPSVMDKPVHVDMVYMRYGQTVGFDIPDMKVLVAEVDQWIDGNRALIEAEMAKPISDMFEPTRNAYCTTCNYCDNAMCPLFRKQTQATISDPENFIVHNDETCSMAWKQIEANKAEAKALELKVRDYLKAKDGEIVEVPVRVDKVAELAIYTDPTDSIDTETAARWLMNKGKAVGGKTAAELLNMILSGCTLSRKEFDKMCKVLKLDFDPESDVGIVNRKFRQTLACRVPGTENDEEE